MVDTHHSKGNKDVATMKFNTRTKVLVKASEVSVSMIEKAVSLADEALSNNMNAGDIAETLKTNFDQLYSNYWQCIVGSKYSSLLSHERGTFIYFYIGNLAVILFKS